jgi:hypothetical protein
MAKNKFCFIIKSSDKKAQLEIQQMLFMLLAVFFFFILAGLFIFSFLYSNLYKEATNAAEEKTYSSITNLADSPEFSCGEINCVDADKLMALIKYNSERQSYDNFWSFSSLVVVKSSGFNKKWDEMIECNPSNYPNCEKFVVYNKNVTNERVISSYVALCRKEIEETYTYDKCEIAKLFAGTKINVIGG